VQAALTREAHERGRRLPLDRLVTQPSAAGEVRDEGPAVADDGPVAQTELRGARARAAEHAAGADHHLHTGPPQRCDARGHPVREGAVRLQQRPVHVAGDELGARKRESTAVQRFTPILVGVYQACYKSTRRRRMAR